MLQRPPSALGALPPGLSVTVSRGWEAGMTRKVTEETPNLKESCINRLPNLLRKSIHEHWYHIPSQSIGGSISAAGR